MKYKKISFCGSSCTGKTILIEAMKKDPQFEGWSFFTNVVRDLHKEGREINEKSNSETQRMIFDRYNEILSKMFEAPSVADRCIIDVAAFTSVLFDQMPVGSEDFIDMSTEEFFQRKEVIRRKDDLSLLVYTPIEFPVENDGERLVDELLRESFDQKIQQILKNSDIPHLRVTGTVEQRMMQIKEVVFSEK